MLEVFNNLDTLLKGFWMVAIPTSVIFIIQMTLTFIGSDASDGTSADFDGDLDGGDTPFQLFSFRNLMNFLLGFSWTGISFYKIINNQLLLITLAIVVGVFFVYLFFLIIRALMRLSEDNTFKLSETIGKTAEVYIPTRRIIVLFMTIMMRLIESCITISLEPLPIAERTERSRQMGRTNRSVPRR